MDVKRELSVELASVVKCALKEDVGEGETLSSDVVNNICNVTEAIFIHGLKSAYFLSAKSAKYPEPNFWPFVTKFSHRNVRAQLSSLSQIKTDIGKGRAWVRLTLNESVLENYLTAFSRERSTVRKFYHRSAYLLDTEQIEVFINYMKAMTRLRIKAPVNSTLLNEWTPTPLRLAGLLNPRVLSPGVVDMDAVDNVEADVMVGVSALDYFNPGGDGSSSDGGSVVSSVAPSLAAGKPKFRVFSDDESSIYSHPSMCDAKFAAVMQDMLVSKSGSSNGTPGPTYEDPDLGDSGIASMEHNPAGALSKVVVHRSTASMAKTARPRASPTPKKIVAEAEIQTETISENDLPKPSETPSNFEDESFMTALDTSTDVGVEKPDEKSFSELLDSSAALVPPRNTMSLKAELSAEKPSDPVNPKRNAHQSPAAFSPGNSLLGRSNWSCHVDLGDYETEHSRASGDVSGQSSITGGEQQSEPNESFGNLLTRTLEKYDPEPSRIEERDGDGDGNDFVDRMNEGETEIGIALGDGESSSEREDSPSKGFVLIDAEDGVVSNSQRILVRLPGESGLDSQNYTCKTCKNPIGLVYGGFRVCAYDGGYYCKECHRNEEAKIPSKIMFSWDLKPKKVSRASKSFLEHVADRPLLNLEQINSSLYDAVGEIKEVLDLRRQLSYVAAYLLTCKESVAEDLRKRLWPKEYLFTDIHLYSLNDLINASSGVLQKHLRSVIAYAIGHVTGCPLCSQKGFVCDCGKLPSIFPFQIETTTRCDKCFSVFHNECVEGRPCPKCLKREQFYRKRKESAAVYGDESLDASMANIMLDDD